MCQPAAQFHVLRPHFVGILITQAGRASKREGGGSREGRHIAHSKIRILKKPLDRNQNAKTWMTNNVILTNTKKKNKTIYHHYLYLQKPDQIWHHGHLWKRNKTNQNPTFQQKTTIELERASTLEEARNSSISCIAIVSWLCKALDVPNLSDICPTWKQLEL